MNPMGDTPSAGDYVDYTLSVENLREGLALLLPSDRVTCNKVGNLMVLRGGEYIGFLNIRGYVHSSEVLELIGVEA